MTTAQLKEYLEIVVDMEKHIFLQDRLIEKWTREINALGKEGDYSKPKQPQAPVLPAPPVKPQEPILETPGKAKRNFLIVFAVLACIGIFSGEGPDLLSGIASGAVIGAIVAGITYAVDPGGDSIKKKSYASAIQTYKTFSMEEYQKKRARIEEAYQGQLRRYQEDMAKYNDDLAKDQKRLSFEAVRKAVLEGELVRLKQQNEKSKEALSKIYNRNIIFQKYRDLVIVCSLCEYIQAGRADSLEGSDGAYNILETELLLKHIITRLDRIIVQLQQIQATQYVAYTAIQEANKTLQAIETSSERIVSQLIGLQEATNGFSNRMQSNFQELQTNTAQFQAQLVSLQRNSALTAYHAERARKELTYMNRMNYLTGRNDGVFFNRPPV